MGAVHGNRGHLGGGDTPLERSQARQGHGCFRCLGLDLATEELTTNTLELLANVQLSGVHVDEVPGEPEYLTLAQAQDQDQDEGGIQRLACMPGRFKEPAWVINCPDATLPAPGLAALGVRSAPSGELLPAHGHPGRAEPQQSGDLPAAHGPFRAYLGRAP